MEDDWRERMMESGKESMNVGKEKIELTFFIYYTQVSLYFFRRAFPPPPLGGIFFWIMGRMPQKDLLISIHTFGIMIFIIYLYASLYFREAIEVAGKPAKLLDI